VITGFNTDIEHDGVVYHVQTEDKGLDTPMILSLVYSGGAILASKRSPYEDLIAAGFSDEVLAERLKRQHRLICAAIHSGRLNELKKMGGRDGERLTGALRTPPIAEVPSAVEPFVAEVTDSAPTINATEDTTSETAYTAESSSVGDLQQALGAQDSSGEGLVVVLMDQQEFSSGDAPTLRVKVTNRTGETEKPLGNVVVSVKILGTTFRPLIYSLKTQRDGVAVVSTEIPHFTSGRAAVLIRAVGQGSAAELRRVIHPSK
jgi:hypothetical protein